MPRAVFQYVVLRMIRSDRKNERLRRGWEGKEGDEKQSRENEMCVKLYSERRAFDDRDGRTDATERRADTKARIRGWNKKLRV